MIPDKLLDRMQVISRDVSEEFKTGKDLAALCTNRKYVASNENAS